MTLNSTQESSHLVLVSPNHGPSAGTKSAGNVKLSLTGSSVAATAVRLNRLVHDDRGQCDDDGDGMGEDSLEHR